MSFAATTWILLGCFLIPLLTLLAAVLVWHWRTRRKVERKTVSDPLLRPPGESLRIKVDELGENLLLMFFGVTGVPAVGMAAVLLSGGAITQGRVTAALIVCLVLLLPGTWWWLRCATKFRAYLLGFHCERATGEELNQLMRDDCFVFHDVPMTPYGNIDHVVVSPAGVFAVETKGHRKRKAPEGLDYWKVVYNGEVLQFPTYRDDTALKQARRQAEQLEKMLSKAVGERVPVSPIVALPGWMVTYEKPPQETKVTLPRVEVRNPKNVRYVVLPEEPPKYTWDQAKWLADLLEEKCRTVEM